ncbi:MAG TPA: hypothetical protein ACQGQH_10075 [Xylella sp.]
MIVVLIISGVVKSGRFQLDSTTDAFDVALQRMRKRVREKGAVAKEIDKLKTGYLCRLRFARRLISAFHILGWIPILIASVIFIANYLPGWLVKLFQGGPSLGCFDLSVPGSATAP